MSIEAHQNVDVSTEAIEGLTAGAEMLAAAHATARDHHPGYSRYSPNEIWCDSWVCGMILTVPLGDCGEAAAAVFEEHRHREAELLLAQWRRDAAEQAGAGEGC